MWRERERVRESARERKREIKRAIERDKDIYIKERSKERGGRV